MSKRILIVEDDDKLNKGICLALQGEDYIFIQCKTLAEAQKALENHEISLILLDVNLPDGNGIEFVKVVRQMNQVPIILITVNAMELDIVMGLEAGANDYITKPFSLMVLRARVAVQMRGSIVKTREHFKQDLFDFNFARMEFFRAGKPIELSKTEQKLLKILCDNQGAAVKRSYLIDQIWQGDTEYVEEHALTVAVKRLRDKIEEDSANPDYIKTVYGIGYTWAVNRL